VAAARIAILKSKTIAAYDKAVAGFVAAYRGPVQQYDLGGRLENAPAVMARIAANPPAALVTVGAKASQAARAYLPRLPLVYCLVLHPAQYGLGAKGVLGVPLRVPAAEEIATLRRIAGRTRRIGVLADPRSASDMVQEARAAARAQGVSLIVARATKAKGVPRAVEWLLPRVDALWLLPDASLVTPESFRFLLLQSFRRGIPVLAFAKSFVRAGALLALAPDYEAMGRAAATLVAELLAGRTPPPAAPPPARIAVNTTTARKLGLKVPPELAARAEVIE
jgi:putative ABC transport system substrate-binding protein